MLTTKHQASPLCLLFGILVVAMCASFIYKKGGLQYLKRHLTLLTITDSSYIATLHPNMVVSGLRGYDLDNRILRRIPQTLEPAIRPALWNLSTSPAGGRIRFRTNSSSVTIRAFVPNPKIECNRMCLGETGIDIYEDGLYSASVWPDASGAIEANVALSAQTTFHAITIYLPLFGPIRVDEVRLEKGARIDPPSDLSHLPPMVFYGSSITQGGNTSNPGLNYPAILSRRLAVDFVNLGFSGNAFGDIEIAKYIASLEASAIVLDYWANTNPDGYRRTLPPFVSEIRRRQPLTPIFIVTPFFTTVHGAYPEMGRIAKEFVAKRVDEGDHHIATVDGTRLLSAQQAYGLSDGLHPNSLGFSLIADGLEGYLRPVVAAGGSH